MANMQSVIYKINVNIHHSIKRVIFFCITKEPSFSSIGFTVCKWKFVFFLSASISLKVGHSRRAMMNWPSVHMVLQAAYRSFHRKTIKARALRCSSSLHRIFQLCWPPYRQTASLADRIFSEQTISIRSRTAVFTEVRLFSHQSDFL